MHWNDFNDILYSGSKAAKAEREASAKERQNGVMTV